MVGFISSNPLAVMSCFCFSFCLFFWNTSRIDKIGTNCVFERRKRRLFLILQSLNGLKKITLQNFIPSFSCVKQRVVKYFSLGVPIIYSIFTSIFKSIWFKNGICHYPDLYSKFLSGHNFKLAAKLYYLFQLRLLPDWLLGLLAVIKLTQYSTRWIYFFITYAWSTRILVLY